jgi:CDGSH-type Zn-finger protein
MAKRAEGSEKANNYKIRISPKGSYHVTGGVPLSEQIMGIDKDGQTHGWKEGKQFESGEHYSLCRCGQSGSKPYCDGTHRTIDFNGEETASHSSYRVKAESIQGPELKLTDKRDLCVHARFCDRAGGIRYLIRKSDHQGAKQIAIEEGCDCPSGRLVVRDENDQPIEPDFEPSIGVVEDKQKGKIGPLWVRGYIPVEGADGQQYEARNRVTLCRCGNSSNKPFCDGNHLD